MSKGVFLSDVADLEKELTVEWPGNSLSSPSKVVQYCLESGIGTLKSTFLDLAIILTMNWHPISDE